MKVDGAATRESLNLLKASCIHAAALTLKAGMAAAESSAKGASEFKDRTGDTRGSVKAVYSGALRGFVEARGASQFLEWGTPPHKIVAKGRALRFVVNGEVIFRKMVNHPGTAPRPYMREARERAVTAIEYGAEIYFGRAIGRAS